MGFFSMFSKKKPQVSEWEVIEDFLKQGQYLMKIWKMQFLATMALYVAFMVISMSSQSLMLSAKDWMADDNVGGFTLYLGVLSITTIFSLNTANAYYTWSMFNKAKKAEKSMSHLDDMCLEMKKVKHLLMGMFMAAMGMYALANMFKQHSDVHTNGFCPVIFFVGFAHLSSTVLKGWLSKMMKTLCYLNTDNF